MEVGGGNKHIWHCSGQNLFETSAKTPPKSLRQLQPPSVQGTASPRGLSAPTRQETLRNPLDRQSPGLCQPLLEPRSPQFGNAEGCSEKGTILRQKDILGARAPHKRAQFLRRPPRPPPSRTPSQQIDQPCQMQVSGLLPRAVLPVPPTKGVQECSTSILMSPKPKPVGAEESQPNSPVVGVPVQREATGLIDQSGSARRTWQVRSDGQRQAPLDFSCPRLQAVEPLLDSPRGLSWIDNAARGLRLPSALRPLLRGRIRLLLMVRSNMPLSCCIVLFVKPVCSMIGLMAPAENRLRLIWGSNDHPREGGSLDSTTMGPIGDTIDPYPARSRDAACSM